ncbi:conserved Plasmodium protein, unknown function [Plasmodium gallinaceum]|uniref:Uncharacterized protein n=1 Tax=Plasmodium gallinaceum TaxID=5849 RepID=A0A1J1GNS6_PLAGA|nr:conserved Plasmodium protein, unknown function [Plasmodium gallinaceum]CRG94053.1 conserved Plasmodium protein, unknown function [Plasmodium gallinaceum]
MEEIELHILKNEIIKIGDKLIDSDDIFQLCERISKSKINQCVDTILECIFYMPMKIGIYATILGIITKNDEKLKLQILLKLNHNIEVFIKKNLLHCLLWFRCIIGLSCCYFFDFSYCLNLFKKIYELCSELYKEKKFIKGDNILYLFLSNFFYISKQIYDKHKDELDDLLNNCFNLIEERQHCIDNIDIDNNDIATIEYIYIYINSIIHSDNFYDRLFYLKDALNNYIQNNLKSVATHRFYQKQIFQEVFLYNENNKDKFIYEDNILSDNMININNQSDRNEKDNNSNDDISNNNNFSNNNNDNLSLHSSKNKEMSLQKIIEKCVNIEYFVNFECEEYISSLQIIFRKKDDDNKNVHDIWLMQEHIMHIIDLYKNSVDFSSKILGIYIQLQSKLYNNVLIECIINKLLSSFNEKDYYFYISLIHRLLLINKNLGSVIIRCIKYILKQIGKLDNESFYLFMELCIYMLSFFVYENKLLKNKENFFKRKFNDMNKILKVQEEKMHKLDNELAKEKEELSGGKKRKTEELVDIEVKEQIDEEEKIEEKSSINSSNIKRNQVVLTKNERTLNELKNSDCKIPFCIEADVKYSSDEDNNCDENDKEKEEYDYDESDNDENDNNEIEIDFDFSIFKEELEKLEIGDNLKKFTNLIYNVKKKYHKKWTRNLYFKSCSLVYKNEVENLLPKVVINYCNKFKCSNDKKHEDFYEFSIFNEILKFCFDEINNIEDQNYDIQKEDNTESSISTFKNQINAFIQCFMNYLSEKPHLNKIPPFFENIKKNIDKLYGISKDNLDVNIFDSHIFEKDFYGNSILWNRYDILILFFKSLIFFDLSNVSSLKKVFNNHSVIFLNYKNSDCFQSEDDKKQFDIEIINIVYTYFNNSVLLNVIVNILVENQIVNELSVIHFIFNKLDDSNLDEYYVLRLIYESIDNLITKKESNDMEKNKLKRKQTKNENEALIKQLEDNKNQLVQKIFHLTNETIIMLCHKMMKLKNENNSYMSKELLKESLVFLRTYLEYVDVDQFLQLCHENNFESELLELATIFKYASLKRRKEKNDYKF